MIEIKYRLSLCLCSATSNSSPNTPHGLHAVSCPPGSKTKCLPWSLAVDDNVLGSKMRYVPGSVNIILLKISGLRLGICMWDFKILRCLNNLLYLINALDSER